jgi:hypothetical protein
MTPFFSSLITRNRSRPSCSLFAPSTRHRLDRATNVPCFLLRRTRQATATLTGGERKPVYAGGLPRLPFRGPEPKRSINLEKCSNVCSRSPIWPHTLLVRNCSNSGFRPVASGVASVFSPREDRLESALPRSSGQQALSFQPRTALPEDSGEVEQSSGSRPSASPTSRGNDSVTFEPSRSRHQATRRGFSRRCSHTRSSSSNVFVGSSRRTSSTSRLERNHRDFQAGAELEKESPESRI